MSTSVKLFLLLFFLSPGQTGSSFLYKFLGEIAYKFSMKLDMYTYEEGMQAFANIDDLHRWSSPVPFILTSIAIAVHVHFLD